MTRWLLVLVVVSACDGGSPAPWPTSMTAPVYAPAPAPVPAPFTPPAVTPPPGPAPAVQPPVVAPPPVAAPTSWAAPPWLCAEDVTTVVRNRGGSSITFRMRVASGGKLAFKPDQLAGYSRFRAELAAYRLSERMGWGHVPPSCERSFSSGALANAAGADEEFVARLGRELRLGPAGRVRGAAILWVEGLRPLDVFPGQIAGHALESELSDMILFDELTGNWDRWSGGNTFTDATGAIVVLIDNAAAFAFIGDERRARMDRVLDRAVSPSPRMLEALTVLTRADVAAALAEVGYDDEVADAVIARRDRMLGRRVSGAAAAR